MIHIETFRDADDADSNQKEVPAWFVHIAP